MVRMRYLSLGGITTSLKPVPLGKYHGDYPLHERLMSETVSRRWTPSSRLSESVVYNVQHWCVLFQLYESHARISNSCRPTRLPCPRSMRWTQRINTPFFLLIIEDIVKVSTKCRSGLVYVPLLPSPYLLR